MQALKAIARPLIISPEKRVLTDIVRGYTDSIGRKITQKKIQYADGVGAKLVIKNPNGSKIVAEGLIGSVPFQTRYYDKNRNLTREVNGIYEQIYTKDGPTIFISRDALGRTGRDIRISFANSPERYEILTSKQPKAEETFVYIRKFINRKLSECYAYFKYDFFGKPQRQMVDDEFEIVKRVANQKGSHPYPVDEVRFILKQANKK